MNDIYWKKTGTIHYENINIVYQDDKSILIDRDGDRICLNVKLYIVRGTEIRIELRDPDNRYRISQSGPKANILILKRNGVFYHVDKRLVRIIS